MICALCIAEHAIRVVHESLRWAEMYLRTQRASIVAWHWCTSRDIGLGICGGGVLRGAEY